jgi:uncharacterized protein YdeI (YjbR/CyaY-like superfamily)
LPHFGILELRITIAMSNTSGTLPTMPNAKPVVTPDAPPARFKNAKAFETWLQRHHATSNGLWLQIAKRGARTATVPEDLIAALDAAPAAKAFFATINATNRYAVLWRIQTAVKPETRARRIAQLVDMLARGEAIHVFKSKG